jgi:hypothetical protein
LISCSHRSLVRTLDGAIVTESRSPIVGDIPFSPEVYFDGEYRPICFVNMDGVESVGNALCLAAGFNGGARVVRNKDKTRERDAIPVSCHDCPFFCAIFGKMGWGWKVFMTACILHPAVISTSIQIENCDPGQTLRSCLNVQYKRDEDIPDACKAGSAVGLEIACNYQVQSGSREG